MICFSELYGAQRSLLSTVRCLDRAAFEPYVAAPPDAAFEAAVARAGARFIPVPMRGLADPAAIAALRRAIREHHIDLVHCHLGISSFLGLIAAQTRGIPAVVTRHLVQDRYTTIANPAVRSAYRGVYKWMNARFDRIICVSRSVKEAVTARENAPAHKCVIIPNGVTLAPPDTLHDGTPPAALQGLPPGRRVAACVSRLSPEKGLHTLIEAAALCVRQGLDLCVVIAGAGPLLGALREQAHTLNISDRVILAGFVDDVPGLLAAAHLFVLPTLHESFGISIVEAMAAGVPVITTATPGPLEIVEHEHNGIVVSPSDPDMLSRAMRRVLNDAALSRKLRSGGLARAAQFD